MPNPSKGARLYLKKRKGRPAQYIIRHTGRPDVFTGCGPHESERANQALAEYLARNYRPDTAKRDLAAIPVTDVLDLYMTDTGTERTPKSAATLGYHVKALLSFWGEKTLADVKGSTCRAYVASRAVKPATARLELKDLQAAINHWQKESPLAAVPKVTLPPPGIPRERFLERREAAALLRAARRTGNHHVARFIIIGMYSGTRHAAILGLRWNAAIASGYVDLDRGVIYRRGTGEAETSKRRPPHVMAPRLLAHMRRWQRIDAASGISRVVHWNGAAIEKMKRAWSTVTKAAGIHDVTPHALRHTFITWELWKGTSIWDVSGMAGADAITIQRVYGHHRPANAERKTA